jgi:acyl-CoA reductase-like NAD-dependent aldehyde dehydrogenase
MAVATGREYGLFINGELVEPQSGDVSDLSEPATGEALARVAMGGEADVDSAVEAARAALDGPWGKTPPTERSRLLHALADAMVANRKELAELEVRNVGKAISSVKAELNQGFPPGAVNVVPGPGKTTGAYLVRHPGVDKVAFTGSTETGGEIMRLASSPIKRITLELGGKSPNLVFADANLADAIPSSVWSIYYSAGQSCEARSRVLVEQSIYDDFVSQFSEKTEQLRLGDPLDPETQVGSLISPAHRDKVHGFVEQGREEGAEVVTGGEADGDGKGAFYKPTVLAKVESSMTVAQEEIFGPVVTVIPFEDEKDAIRIANDVRYGLMATVWTGDPARGHRIASRIKAGTVGINTPYTAFPGIPFGGYKQSGFGRELGLDTLELYLESKSVLVGTGAKPFNPFGL